MNYRSLLTCHHELTHQTKESIQLSFLYLYPSSVSKICEKTQIPEFKFQIYINYLKIKQLKKRKRKKGKGKERGGCPLREGEWPANQPQWWCQPHLGCLFIIPNLGVAASHPRSKPGWDPSRGGLRPPAFPKGVANTSS